MRGIFITVVAVLCLLASPPINILTGYYGGRLIKATVGRFVGLGSIDWPEPTHQQWSRIVRVPLLGRMFVQKQVYGLVQQRKWTQVLERCSQDDGLLPLNTSNKLTMYRAIAECATHQFKKCEDTLSILQLTAPKLHQKLGILSNAQKQGSVTQSGEFSY